MWIYILLLVILALSVYKYSKTEHFATSSQHSIRSGASTFYDWGYKPLKCHRKHHHKTECYLQPEERTINNHYEKKNYYVDKDYYLMQKESCKNAMDRCPITEHPEIDKYVLKSSIPAMPDMDKYATKNMVHPCLDPSKYVLKSEVQPSLICPPCPDLPNISKHPDFKNYIHKKHYRKMKEELRRMHIKHREYERHYKNFKKHEGRHGKVGMLQDYGLFGDWKGHHHRGLFDKLKHEIKHDAHELKDWLKGDDHDRLRDQLRHDRHRQRDWAEGRLRNYAHRDIDDDYRGHGVFHKLKHLVKDEAHDLKDHVKDDFEKVKHKLEGKDDHGKVGMLSDYGLFNGWDKDNGILHTLKHSKHHLKHGSGDHLKCRGNSYHSDKHGEGGWRNFFDRLL